MATYSKIASGRPNLPTSYSHHGYGSPTNQMPYFSYEGYLFVPSEHSSPEDRWTYAQPIKILVSQHDLFNEITKQQRSGKTALEDFCGPRLDDAKRGIINKLIKERTNSESGSTYTLAAINIDGDRVSDEEPKSGKTSLPDHESEKKDLKKQSKKTAPILIVLQGSVNHYRNGVSIGLSQNFNSNPAADSIGTITPATSWNAPNSSTPLAYLPLSYSNLDPIANWSDPSSTPQQVYQRNDGTRTERSSSVTSFDTASSSSLFTPMSATSNKDCSITVDHAKDHNGLQVLTPLSAYPWSGISTPTECPKEGFLPQNAHKQQLSKAQQQSTGATDRARPFLISVGTQTDSSMADPRKDGRHETLDDLKKSNGRTGPPSTAKHGRGSKSVSGQSTSEFHTISTKDLTGNGDSPLPSQVPRSRSPDILEQKPSWMDNMVPVIPSPEESKPIQTVLDEAKAESLVIEDCNSKPAKAKDTERQNARKSSQLEQQEASCRHPKSDGTLTALAGLATAGVLASVIDPETKPTKKKDTEHQHTRKSHQSKNQETSYRHTKPDESSAALPRPGKQAVQAPVKDAEAKGKKVEDCDLKSTKEKATEHQDASMGYHHEHQITSSRSPRYKESVTEDIQASVDNAEAKPTKKQDTLHQNARQSFQIEHQEPSYPRPRCGESSAAVPRPATEGIKASVQSVEAKPTKKDTEHKDARKSYQLEQQESSYRHPEGDVTLTVVPRSARADIHSSGKHAEAKGRKASRPQYTGTLSDTSVKVAANEACNHPPPLSRPVSYHERYLPPSVSRPASAEARYPPPSLGRPRSYERLRPTDHTSQQSPQPVKIGEYYNETNHGATDPKSSHISGSARVSSFGKDPSFEKLRYDDHPIPSVSQPPGIRKIYKVKTYDEPDRAPNKHVQFSQPISSSSSVIACNGSDITCPDWPPSYTQTVLAGEHTEPPRTTSWAISRPSLPRQSSYIPAQSPVTRPSHHSSPKTSSNKQSSTSTRREVKSSDRKPNKGNDSYNSGEPDGNSDGEPKIIIKPLRCPYDKCHRMNDYSFTTQKALAEHKYIAHKRSASGRK